MNVTPSGWVFLALICVFLPLMAIRTALRVRQPGRSPTRVQHLTSVFVTQAMTLALALSAARYEDIRLFPPPSLGAFNLAVVLAFLVPTLGTLPMRWSWKSEVEKRRMIWMLPHGSADLWWWTIVALAAAIVEEIVYRGVMITLWQRILGSWWAAMVVCVAVFSLVHFLQGWRAMAAIALTAMAAHLIVRGTGDLYTAITVHFIYDLLAGFVLLRCARRDGVLPTDAFG
jgi:membrane protease YdiL (CAAX protease family)